MKILKEVNLYFTVKRLRKKLNKMCNLLEHLREILPSGYLLMPVYLPLLVSADALALQINVLEKNNR